MTKIKKINKDAIVKTTVIIVLPFVIAIVLLVIYRFFLFENTFINKTILKKDMQFKYHIFDEFDSRKGNTDVGSTYLKSGGLYLTDSGKNNFDHNTIKMLDDARHIIEMGWNKQNPSKRIAFRYNSAYRTDIRNAEVGGVKNSAHRNKDGQGAKGVDIKWNDYSKEQKLEMLDALAEVGFKRFGKANSFLHVDNDYSLPNPAVWLYGGYNNIV